jgi:hypothetical protein
MCRQVTVPTALFPGIHRLGGSVSPRAGTGMTTEEENPCPWQESNPVVSHLLIYPGLLIFGILSKIDLSNTVLFTGWIIWVIKA